MLETGISHVDKSTAVSLKSQLKVPPKQKMSIVILVYGKKSEGPVFLAHFYFFFFNIYIYILNKYINDICFYVDTAFLSNYADDTALY